MPEADELTHRGVELLKKQQYAEAEALFRTAFASRPAYDIAGNLGLAEAGLGKWRAAAEHLTLALETFPANGKAKHRELIGEKLAEVLKHVGQLLITVNGPSGETTLDGENIGEKIKGRDKPTRFYVEPGKHKVEAVRHGEHVSEEDAPAGERRNVVRNVATLRVSANLPDARLFLDGQPLSDDDRARDILVEARDHKLDAKRPYYQQRTSSGIVLRPGETRSVELELGRVFTPLIVGESIAGAAVVAGAVLMAVGGAKRSDALHTTSSILAVQGTCVAGAANYDPRCPQLADTANAAHTLRNGGTGVLVGAGVAAAATLTVFYVLPLLPEAQVAVRVAPPTQGKSPGVLVEGVF